ncbi:unnamed protein product [Adineta ricciae]|uniref:G-protein coupled receptors family 1 profile domain-containing protein n=1 Tax=Adineta ricciae TaxID=249248 RepID=A0A814JR92_ADIRI|nr:unnamed protein product [Adineta ricciae]CAF1041113.1 unnamed protein product [Adineta ricciae]
MTISSSMHLQYLYNQYATTYLSFSELYTYEVVILLIYGIMIIFSFCTNFIAIVIFFFGRRSRSELTPFLLNLSVFNIIMTVYCIPFTMTSIIFQRWLFASTLCTVLDGLKTFSVSGVLLTLITIAIDRYCVVKYPSMIKMYSPKKRNLVAILTIWILSILLAIAWSPARSSPTQEKRLWINSRTLLNDYMKSLDNYTDTSRSNDYLAKLEYKVIDTLQCLPNKIARPVEVQRAILNSLQTYFFPLFILGFVYLRIAVILWQRRNDVNYDLNNGATKNLFTNETIQFKKKLKQGIKMLIAVVALYAILWLPMNVFQLCLNLLCFTGTKHQKFCAHPTLIKLLYIACHFLTVSNTALNPIIYGFTNNRFRSDIRQLRRRLIHCQARTPSYLQSQPLRTGKDVQDRPLKQKCTPNLTASKTPRILIQPKYRRPISLSEQNRVPRPMYSFNLSTKDVMFSSARHTT